MSPLELLDYASVLIFALTGALVASRAQLDVVGFAFLACLTGVATPAALAGSRGTTACIAGGGDGT